MILKSASRSECYAYLESYQSRADHADFPKEFGRFCCEVTKVIEDCNRTVVATESAPDGVDFLLPPDYGYPDDRVLVIVTFKGSQLTKTMLFELSCLVQEHDPKYHIFIDGQVSHGLSFEIVLKPDGQVLGHECDGTNLLGKLGFPGFSENQQAEQAAAPNRSDASNLNSTSSVRGSEG